MQPLRKLCGLVAFGAVMITAAPATAQTANVHYNSPDGTVRYVVPEGWVSERELNSPGQHYRVFWYERELPSFDPIDNRNWMLIEVVNRETTFLYDLPMPKPWPTT